jgi:signal transduction histidine kinase
LEFNPTPLDLVALCEEIIEEVKVGYPQNIHINFVHQGLCEQVSVDEFLLRHILQNLVSNAIKYSKVGGTVNIVLACSTTHLTIRVEDHGIGIPQQHQHRLFEAFHRAANVGQIQGTGIGLTIVKRAVDAHGGAIEFNSVEGQGTTFIIRLPFTNGDPIT